MRSTDGSACSGRTSPWPLSIDGRKGAPPHTGDRSHWMTRAAGDRPSCNARLLVDLFVPVQIAHVMCTRLDLGEPGGGVERRVVQQPFPLLIRQRGERDEI